MAFRIKTARLFSRKIVQSTFSEVNLGRDGRTRRRWRIGYTSDICSICGRRDDSGALALDQIDLYVGERNAPGSEDQAYEPYSNRHLVEKE